MVCPEDSAGESMCSQLFEASPDGQLVVAENGRVRMANAEAYRILGWAPGTLVEQLLSDVLPERFRNSHPVTPHPSLVSPQQMGEIRDTFVAHRRDGTEIPVEITMGAIRIESEELHQVVIRDVSAWYEAEQKLREGDETFRLLVAGVRDYAIFFLDPDGHVMTWNEGAERIKGYRSDEIIGQSFVRFYLPQDVIAGVPSRMLKRASEEGVATDEGVRVRKDGSRFWAHVVITALRDKSGRLRGFAKITRDISDQKHAQQAITILADASRLLAESLEAEQILFTVMHIAVPAFADAVLIHRRDPQGEPRLELFHAANPGLLAAVGELHRKDALRAASPSRRVMQTGRSELHAKLTPEWLVSQKVDAALAGVIRRFGVSSTIHVPIISDGRPVAVIIFAAAGTRVYNEHDLVFAEELSRRASTAMHNAELFQKAKRERERAEEAVMLRERLVAIVGHDLRTPLSSISMAAQMLGSHALGVTDEQLVARIQRSASRMTRMIGQILDFARIRSGQTFELKLEVANTHQVCRAVIDELRLSKPDQEIELSLDGRPDAVVDADRLAQVVSNLVGNAIQHGIAVPITVTVRDAAPDAVAIDVHNAGPPIPKALQAGLFEAFHREKTGKSGNTSIGLGLFIANEIVRAHGGSLGVRSPDRDGTTFSVVLPRLPGVSGWVPTDAAAEQLH